MELYFSHFIAGINDSLNKLGYDNVFDITGTIFPTISSQSKWHFAKTPTHIHLNDGFNVYTFHTPEGSKDAEDFPLTKESDIPLNEFGKDAEHTSTAQVHRADPGHIYFTVQDGKSNPTYTFKHVSGGQWRAIPKVKHNDEKPIVVDQNQFLEGVKEKVGSSIIEKILQGTSDAASATTNGVMDIGKSPIESAGAGLLGGAAYDLGKRRFYNSEEENQQETAMDRLRRYVLPTAAAGASGALLRGTFPSYYNDYPVWKQ